MKKLILCIVLAALCLPSVVSGHPQTEPITTFETGKSPAQEIHVATDGDDSTGDGSIGTPYATVARAIQDAGPGAAIRIHAGTYHQRINVNDLAGSAEAPIWIGGAPGEAKPVIEGVSEAMHLSKVRYLVIHDIEVDNASQNGINCDDGGEYSNDQATQHVIFRDLYIHDVGSGGNEDCLKLSGVNDYFVLDSEFTRCGGGISGSGVDHVGCHGGLLADNYFHDLSANAVQCKGGSEDIEIRGNLIVDAGERGVNMGGSTGTAYFRPPLSTTEPNAEARDIRVIANVIRGGVASLAFVGCVDCLAANNTLIDPTNWLMRILQETTTSGEYEFLPCSNNRVINNLVTFDRSDLATYEMINIGNNTSPDTFIFANNLWYAHNDPSQSQPNVPVEESAPVVGEDPLLADPATYDYHLQSGSPAAGAGTAVEGVLYDYDGTLYNSPPSIGAFEGNTLLQPDLSPSSKGVSKRSAVLGEQVTYTLSIRNAGGPLAVQAWLTDTLPEGLDYVPGSLVASSGTVDAGAAPTLYWTGSLSPTPIITLTYMATVTYTQSGGTTAIPTLLRNTAELSAEGYGPITLTATLPVNNGDVHALYLPLILRSSSSAQQRGVAQAVQTPVLKWQNGGCYSSWCETGWYASPAVADLDNDGTQEVIAGDYSIFILNGEDGTLQRHVDMPGDRIWPGVAVADIDNNGDLEIITGQGEGYLNVLDHNGDLAWSQNPMSNEFRGLALSDLDNDRTMEIVVSAARGNQVNTWVYEHDATLRGGWPQLASGAPGWAWGIFNDNVAVGDIDGDGAGEIIAPSDMHYICAYESDGSPIPANAMYGGKVWGQVGIWEDLTVELRGWGQCDGVRAESYRTNFADGPAVIADVDGNGTMEIVVTGNVYDCDAGYPPSVYTGVYIFNADRSRFNNGTYDWQTLPVDIGTPIAENYNVIESAQSNPVVADLDGDGEQEILFSAYDGLVHAFWLDKTQHHAWPYAVTTGGTLRFASEPAVADLDNDGKAEVIVATWTQKDSNQTGDLIILDYQGNVLQQIALPAPYSASRTWNGALAAPTLANIDDDADLEVVLNTVNAGFVAYDLPGTAKARILWGTGRGNYLRNGYLDEIPAPYGSLDNAYKSVEVDIAGSDAILNYTIHLENDGVSLPNVHLTDTLPAGVTYRGDLAASSGSYDESGGVITWNGTVESAVPVDITFSVSISQTATMPTSVLNAVLINDGQGNLIERSAGAVINGRHIYLPLVMRQG